MSKAKQEQWWIYWTYHYQHLNIGNMKTKPEIYSFEESKLTTMIKYVQIVFNRPGGGGGVCCDCCSTPIYCKGPYVKKILHHFIKYKFYVTNMLVGWLVMFNVPSTARSFRDGTPIYCPLRRTWSSINTPFRPGIEPRTVAWQSITLPLSHASSTNKYVKGGEKFA